jgi:hypothetical protein
MRHLPSGLLVPVLAWGLHAHVIVSGATAMPAEAAAASAQQESERSVCLVLRIKPDQLKKVASELAQMVQGGDKVGLPWLREAFGAVSAEIVVEDTTDSGTTSAAFRASSAGWTGRAPARPRGDAKAAGPPASDAEAGLPSWVDPKYATAAAIIGRHASAIRDGASALMDTLPAGQAEDLRQQLQQLTTTAGALGKTLEGILPAKPAAEKAVPKR